MPSNANNSFGVVYLGRRGAGLTFCVEITRSLMQKKILNFSLVSKKANFPLEEKNIVELRVPHEFRDWFLLIFTVYDVLRNMKRIFQNKPNAVIFPMPSPLDNIFAKYYILRGIKVIRIIHDVEPHPGDSWPTKRAINRRINFSDELVFLSNHVKEQYLDLISRKVVKEKIYQILEHPVFPITLELNTADLDIDNSYILVIGRIQPYKGIPTLVDSWIKIEKTQVHDLLIVGNGNLDNKTLSIIGDSKSIKFINRWITDDEFSSLVAGSAVVLLPYRSASQSGVIPLAKFLRKVIVVSGAVGLVEQIENYPLGIVCENVADPAALSYALKKAHLIEDSTVSHPYNRDFESFTKRLISHLPSDHKKSI